MSLLVFPRNRGRGRVGLQGHLVTVFFLLLSKLLVWFFIFFSRVYTYVGNVYLYYKRGK